MAELFWLNEVQWAAIEPLLCGFRGKPSRRSDLMAPTVPI